MVVVAPPREGASIPAAHAGSTLARAGLGGDAEAMRYESSVTSLSWIPSEAVPAGMRVPFDTGILHYDPPPPDVSTTSPRCRRRTGSGSPTCSGPGSKPARTARSPGTATAGGGPAGGFLGATTVRAGLLHRTFQAVQLPDRQRTPEEGPGWVRFSQTVGGRTAIPSPTDRVAAAYVQWQAPLVWTTLSLTLHADGRTEYAMTGASPFPRHWVYDDQGR